MTDDVTALWWPDDITAVTDTDLAATRHVQGQLADPSDYSIRLVETARQAHELETRSATIDRGVRIAIAYLIDEREVLFSRGDYDITHTIPPASWVDTHRPPEAALLSVEELPDDTDVSERSIAYTTPEVVYEMTKEASEQLDMTLSAIGRSGVERMVQLE